MNKYTQNIIRQYTNTSGRSYKGRVATPSPRDDSQTLNRAPPRVNDNRSQHDLFSLQTDTRWAMLEYLDKAKKRRSRVRRYLTASNLAPHQNPNRTLICITITLVMCF